MAIEEKIKRKIIAVVSALIPEAKIYLYGSRARGTAYEFSDIDLALDRGSKIPFRDVGEVRDALTALHIPYKVDVVDIHSIDPKMREIILDEGILWKET